MANLIETIRRVYPELTKSQKQLADYVAESYRQAAFMNASELASALELNEATVIRFAQRLGFDGYPELVAAIRELVQQELLPQASLEDATEHPLLSMLSNELENALQYYRTVSSDMVQQVVDSLAAASHVCVIGQGLSRPLAELLCGRLAAVGIRASCPAADPQSLAIALESCDRDSVVVGISADDDHGALVPSALRIAQQIPARTLAISRSPVSAAAQAANMALTCPQMGELPLPSITTMAALIDMLSQALGALDPERTRELQREVNKRSARILDSLGRR